MLLPHRIVIASMVLAVAASSARADSPDLAFRPAGDGLFEFNTGVLKGRLKAVGKSQGVYPLVHVDSGAELVHAPGVLSFYRVLKTNGRYGNGARDWPTLPRLLADGAVEVVWPPAEEHPIALTGLYRWVDPVTLDLEITARPQQAMPQFELFLSSYFTRGFLASVFLQDDRASPRFISADRCPGMTGGYVMFPRDDAAVARIKDGRWKIPPNPVDWAIGGRLAAPLVLRRDKALGLTACLMGLPNDCFAISSPFNPATPEGGGYRSLYLSLFGRDLQAGETARTRCRLIIADGLSNAEAVRRYEGFVKQPAQE